MFLASVVVSGREWVLPAAILAVGTVCLLAWTYRQASSAGIRLACILLKLLGVLTLAACIIDPLWSGQRAKPGANLFAVVADNSQGMQIKDAGATMNRAQELRDILDANSATWLEKLDDTFQVRRYFFDSRVQSTRDFAGMNFDGRASSIGNALRTIGERYRGQPLSGILMLTDGNATDLPDGRMDTTGLPPIYPVVIGKDDAIKDVSLEKVSVSQTVFEDAPVSIQADVADGGYSGHDIVAQLFNATGAMVQEKTMRSRGDSELLPFRFELKPEKPGVSFYNLRVSAKDELGQFDKPETSTEATLANNSRVLVADRGGGPYRILYIGGQPKWEFKFMNRALEEDDQIQLVSLIRIARREPKFEFRGRAGEVSNPLFRGFDNQARDEVQSYDQPVLERLNTRDQAELVNGFPRTEEELYQYSAIVLDDVEADFFTRDQQALIQKFVSERGGGFMMLGGAESFHEGHYERTPVGEMLPVYLEHIPEGSPITNAHFNLTHEGWLEPWARLRSTEADEKKRLDSMTHFDCVNRVREPKPGASVIATVHDDHGDYPALVTQRFGKGRVGALMISDLYQWGFQDEDLHKDMDKAWRQLYRWLIADVPNRVNLTIEPVRGDPNEAVTLQVHVRDKKFQPMDNVNVTVTVRTVTGGIRGTNASNQGLEMSTTNSVILKADPSGTEPGVYEITYVPRDSGGYLAEAVVTDSEKAEVGSAQAGWTADPAAEEFHSLKPNRALMEQIARQTGGEVISAAKLQDFAASLPNKHAPVTEDWSYPLWHRSTVFLFALACLIAEWGLRRWKGMA